MITANIRNRAASVALPKEFKLPEDGFFHIAKKGEFPGTMETADGKELNVVQVVDDEAIAEMVNNFKKAAEKEDFAGLLVDRDHLSHDPENTTEAEGWIEEVSVRNNDLLSRIRLSDIGTADIKGGRYRFISSEWDVKPIGQKDFTEGCRVRPFRLTGAGLTNRPNIRGLNALTNRKTTLTDDPSNSPAEQADIQNRNKKTMKQIATKLGLSADASEDAILGELAKVMNRATTAEAKVTPLETEVTTLKNRLTKIEDDSAESEMDAAGITKDDADRPAIKTALISNREGGRALLKKIAKPAPRKEVPARMTNRENAKAPGTTTEESPQATQKAEANAGAIRNRANVIAKTGVPFTKAWKQAKSEFAAKGA